MDREEFQRLEEEDMICYCFFVSRQEIEKAIREDGLDTVEDIQDKTNACMGCRTCYWDIEQLIAKIQSEED